MTSNAIFRFSFALGTVLLCFGLTYYSTHSPPLIEPEEKAWASYWTLRGELAGAQESLAAAQQESPKWLEKKLTEWRADRDRGRTPEERQNAGYDIDEDFAEARFQLGAEDIILQARQHLVSVEGSLKEQSHKKNILLRERLILSLGSAVCVLGGLAFVGYGFLGWRRFNREAYRQGFGGGNRSEQSTVQE